MTISFDAFSDVSVRYLLELATQMDLLLDELDRLEKEQSKLEQINIVKEQTSSNILSTYTEFLHLKSKYQEIQLIKDALSRGNKTIEQLDEEQKIISTQTERKKNSFMKMKKLLEFSQKLRRTWSIEILYLAFEVINNSNLEMNEEIVEMACKKIQIMISLSEKRDELAKERHRFMKEGNKQQR